MVSGTSIMTSVSEQLFRIARELSSIGAANLGERVSMDGLPQEIVPLVAEVNALLARLETAFGKERRFASIVAHELRTPVTELRLLAESGTQETSDLRAIALGMDRRISTLLATARSDSGGVKLSFREVDLPELVEEAFEPYAKQAEARKLSARFRMPERAGARTDPSLLAAILSNLLGNAVLHTPSGGDIECDLSPEDGRWAFSLENTNDTVVPEDIAHLFEPFWRKDEARSDPSHAGLGLSLVETYGRLLALDFEISLPARDLFRVSFHLPAS